MNFFLTAVLAVQMLSAPVDDRPHPDPARQGRRHGRGVRQRQLGQPVRRQRQRQLPLAHHRGAGGVFFACTLLLAYSATCSRWIRAAFWNARPPRRRHPSRLRRLRAPLPRFPPRPHRPPARAQPGPAAPASGAAQISDPLSRRGRAHGVAAAGMRKASEFPLLRLMYRNSSTDGNVHFRVNSYLSEQTENRASKQGLSGQKPPSW